MRTPSNRTLTHAPLAALACALALALAGCGSGSVSTAGFKGEEHEVAQAIANLQSDTSSQDPGHVCSNDLAQTLVGRLNQAPGGCERAIKDQLAEIDPGLEVKVESVHIAGARTATATVKSTFEGKHRLSTLELVKEGGRWKIAGLK
jgi:hypothetical protein